jgi:hypothetical protein
MFPLTPKEIARGYLQILLIGCFSGFMFIPEKQCISKKKKEARSYSKK